MYIDLFMRGKDCSLILLMYMCVCVLICMAMGTRVEGRDWCWVSPLSLFPICIKAVLFVEPKACQLS